MRNLTIKVKPISGLLNLFHIFIDGHSVKDCDGQNECVWNGEIKDTVTNVEIQTVGANGTYSIKINSGNGVNIDETKTFEGGTDAQTYLV